MLEGGSEMNERGSADEEGEAKPPKWREWLGSWLRGGHSNEAEDLEIVRLPVDRTLLLLH